MCGIAGYVQRSADPAPLAIMLARIAHRGPDGSGTHHAPAGSWAASIGHRRLAIIDLDGGAQPMPSVDEPSSVISFNGEVYNFMDLRAPLEARGRSFRTRSDTEVVLQHVLEKGEGGLVDLNGMFAFALWEPKRRRLLLARDRAGIKPLFYATLPDGGIVFASELDALAAHPGVDRAPSVEGYASYFFADYFQPPYTALAGARQLPPGHFLVWEEGKLGKPVPFYRLPASGRAPRGSLDDLAHETWSRLDAAVTRQLIADVPVGIFLSGGLDSSSVAVLAARHARDRMKAFAIGFEDRTFDESAYARRVAKEIGVELVSDTLRERDLIDVTDDALAQLDEPLADPSYLPTYLLSRLAARHVKVVVGGDGGDELWGGYPTYRAHRYGEIYRHLPSIVRKRLIPGAVGMLPVDDRYQSLEWKLKRFACRWDDDAIVRHQRWMSSVDLGDLARVVPSAAGVVPATLTAHLPPTRDALQRILALDFSTYMSGSVLTKVDRASMAHGLEVRPPLLDNDMIEWAFTIPSSMKVSASTGKLLLKRAARGKVPDDVIDRPKKGFGIPLAAWLRGPLRERLGDVFSSSPLWDDGFVDRRVLETWRDEHWTRQIDRSKPLWALLVLDRWARRMRAFPAQSLESGARPQML